MQTQKGILRSIVLISTLVIFALFLIPSGTGHASELESPPGDEHTIYLPVIRREQPGAPAAAAPAIGVELTGIFILNPNNAAEIAGYDLDYIRGHLGSMSEPYNAVYQLYLSGGWAAADERVLSSLEGWRGTGAEPVFIFMPGGECGVPSYAALDNFGDFIAAAVERYDLNYFEVWNEPDVASGGPAVYGCFGTAHAGKLIYLLERIRPQIASHRQMGVSFMMENPAHFAMMEEIAPYVDFVGIHHYGVWGGGMVQESDWPGSLEKKYDLVDAAVDVPVWITELNLRSPSDQCGPAHQAAARDYIEDALDVGAPMISILVYKAYPDWQCTGIRDTLVADLLMQVSNPSAAAAASVMVEFPQP